MRDRQYGCLNLQKGKNTQQKANIKMFIPFALQLNRYQMSKYGNKKN